MTDTNLPWRIFGRQLRPYALAVSLSTALIGYAIWTGTALGQLLDGFPGHVIATAAVAAVTLLWVGWWVRSNRLMRSGLFWTTGVWASVTAVLAIDVGWNVNTMLAACWVVASGGAWLLEATDARGGA